MAEAAPGSIDEYVATFPAPVRKLMTELRRAIRSAAPGVRERISYRIAAFEADGPLIYFAGFKSHIGLYPVPRDHPDFAEELAAFKGGKGTAQFPLDQPLPLDLVKRIVKFRRESNRERAAAKRKKKKR